MPDHVVNNAAERQYELATRGEIAIAAYSRDGDIVTFTHTVVPEALEGHGTGTALIAGALADVREQGLRIVPNCSFVRHYVETHPDAQDLLAR